MVSEDRDLLSWEREATASDDVEGHAATVPAQELDAEEGDEPDVEGHAMTPRIEQA